MHVDGEVPGGRERRWRLRSVTLRCTEVLLYEHYIVITVLRFNYVTLRYVTLGFRILHCNAQLCCESIAWRGTRRGSSKDACGGKSSTIAQERLGNQSGMLRRAQERPRSSR